jgi:3-oxoacyl-[acyl-carrier-protein] synthase-3
MALLTTGPAAAEILRHMGALPQTTIDAVAAYLPPVVRTVEQTAPELGLNRAQARVLRRAHGFGALRETAGGDVVDLVERAALVPLRAVADRRAIRYLIFAHTVPSVTPAHLPAVQALRERLDLPRAEALAITQQHCASGLSALDIAGELLRASPDRDARALVLVGEKRLPPLARLVARTCALGEASVACLVGLGGERDRVLSYADRTVRLLTERVWTSPESEREFNDGYARNLAAVMAQAVRRAGIGLGDVTMVVPHNVSRMLWSRTADLLGIGLPTVFLETIGEYGHCLCADPFLNFAALRDAGRLVPGGRYLLTAVGLGSTYAAMIIEH